VFFFRTLKKSKHSFAVNFFFLLNISKLEIRLNRVRNNFASNAREDGEKKSKGEKRCRKHWEAALTKSKLFVFFFFHLASVFPFLFFSSVSCLKAMIPLLFCQAFSDLSFVLVRTTKCSFFVVNFLDSFREGYLLFLFCCWFIFFRFCLRWVFEAKKMLNSMTVSYSCCCAFGLAILNS